MRAVLRRLLTATILAAAVGGCASGNQGPAARPADQPNLLAGCGPIGERVIADLLGVPQVRPQTQPTVCTWIGDHPAGGSVDVTYAWLQDDTLMRDLQVADRLGYTTEKVVLKRFGGMYWRDPRDPGSCAVTTADTGTITWWVHNRDRAAQPDPCAAAMALMQATLSVDGI